MDVAAAPHSRRYNPPGGELLAFAFAAGNDFRGPYINVFNLTNGQPGAPEGSSVQDAYFKSRTCAPPLPPPPAGDEDPFAWQQPDGSLHTIYHNKGFGYHAFATDDGGRGGHTWAVSPTGSHAFTLSLQLDNGTDTLLQRRERPELRLDPARGGVPATLYNGVLAADGTAFVAAQAVGTGQ